MALTERFMETRRIQEQENGGGLRELRQEREEDIKAETIGSKKYETVINKDIPLSSSF